MKRTIVSCVIFLLVATACNKGTDADAPRPYASRYQPLASDATLLQGATVLTGTGERLDDTDVLMRDGRIAAIGSNIDAAGASVVDASEMWVTPGVIDVHSHLGVYASPGVPAHSDGNEMSTPVTAEVWAEHAVWPQDPGFVTALAGGVTSMQILPALDVAAEIDDDARGDSFLDEL